MQLASKLNLTRKMAAASLAIHTRSVASATSGASSCSIASRHLAIIVDCLAILNRIRTPRLFFTLVAGHPLQLLWTYCLFRLQTVTVTGCQGPLFRTVRAIHSALHIFDHGLGRSGLSDSMMSLLPLELYCHVPLISPC